MDRKILTETATNSFLLWYSQVHLVPFDLEFKVYSEHSAGTCDFVGLLTYPAKKIINKVYYIDWKSSFFVNPEQQGPQIAAYKYMDGRYPDAGIAVLHLNRDKPMFDWKNYTKQEKRRLFEWYLMERMFFSRKPRIAKKAGWI